MLVKDVLAVVLADVFKLGLKVDDLLLVVDLCVVDEVVN